MDLEAVKKILLDGEKVDLECKEAKNSMPKSVYESYSGFANTNGGRIILGVREDKNALEPKKRFVIEGVENPKKILEDFWNTINSNKVNANILIDKDVYIVSQDTLNLIIIEVPRADYKLRPIYVGENPYKGTYKRNNEGDYHCSEDEIRAMIRDQNPDGNDGLVLENYSMEDIDQNTLKRYRTLFQSKNPGHIWNEYGDQEFLEKLGGYRKDRRKNIEGVTLAGLLMFGKGLAVRDEFDNIFMDYRDERYTTTEVRWNDRVTYDGTWENNLFNYFSKVIPKLVEELKKPFKMEGIQRVDDTPVHRAIREAFVNMIIHADYLSEGILKIIKKENEFSFTNPGILKLPKSEIFKGGNSRARNPRMQTMLRLVGFGDNAGSGFPFILATWENENWINPELIEDTGLNQVTLKLSMIPKREKGAKKEPKRSQKKEPKKGADTRKAKEIKDRKNNVLKLIRNDEAITQAEIMEKLDISRKQIQDTIKSLIEEGKIVREGSNRNGYWKIQD